MTIPDIKTVAMSCLNGLRAIVKNCDDRDVSRLIYTELRSIAHQLAIKHNFPAEVKERIR